MRVSFSIPLKPVSGKQKFAIRLSESMRKRGVKITNKRPDINFVFVKGLRKGCKNIFRLDGVWMDRRINYKKRNSRILETMKACDGVIYQNEFCKKAADVFLGCFASYAIILNGASLSTCDITPFHHRRPYLLSFNRWRPHKRLKDTVVGFLHSGLDRDYDLIVAGDNPDYVIKNPSVIYKGRVSKDLWQLIMGCEYAIHLAYCDWCPNSVVEALVCGKNVIHSSVGGTKYIVKSNGISVNDKKWRYNPIHLYDPPLLNLDELANGYHKMFLLPPPTVSYLDINVISDKYIDYCRKVLL